MAFWGSVLARAVAGVGSGAALMVPWRALWKARSSARQMEYNLLVHLARDSRRVFRSQELLRAVWGYKAPGSTRTLDSYASRLRRKLAAQGERWVINVRGVGFRLI